MSKAVYIINGPNLNMLGKRQPEIYGTKTLDDVKEQCRSLSHKLDLEVKFHQSNHEGKLVDLIQEARDHAIAIIINPAAYTHTSVAILDALLAFDGPVIEVHLSNPHQRENFRHYSYTSQRANSAIIGCGTNGYLLALRQVHALISDK